MHAHPSPTHDTPPLPESLLERFSSQNLARGYLVSTPHATDNRILILREGRIRVFVASEDKELTLAYLVPGELFSTHTRAYLRCESTCTLLGMPTAQFARTLANEPGMLSLIMPVLGRILDNSIAIIEDLAFRDVAGRLARFLLVWARQQGVAQTPGMQFTLDLSAGEIALLLGCTRQTVSSLLGRLQRENTIARFGQHQLCINDPQALIRWQEGLEMKDVGQPTS
jgi:CRP-like cAMP-binding protein